MLKAKKHNFSKKNSAGFALVVNTYHREDCNGLSGKPK